MGLPMYGTVLAPTDGSDLSIDAAEEAIALTDEDGTLHVLAVLEKLPLYRRAGMAEKFEGEDDDASRAHLDEAIDRITVLAEDQGIDYETHVAEGVPYREIVTSAEELEADAIVLGKRGMGADADDMLGSTTERVIRRATTRVISIPER